MFIRGDIDAFREANTPKPRSRAKKAETEKQPEPASEANQAPPAPKPPIVQSQPGLTNNQPRPKSRVLGPDFGPNEDNFDSSDLLYPQ